MLILVTALFNLTMLIIPNNWIKIAIADEKEVIKSVYLTFDDGPSDKVTPKILDILDGENVKATFFIIGKNAETRPYLIEREHNSGHTVAVHSYSHEYSKIYKNPQNLLNDISACNDIIYKLIGTRSTIYRFPGGSYGLNNQLIQAVCSSGYRYVDWNASLRDAEIWNPTPQQLIDSAISTSANSQNVVLLAHDSTTKTSTALALKQIINYYKQNGYSFETF
jgi:peptidoglycan/xylan/chitin deacetylase (PgdA/CDA1 family)